MKSLVTIFVLALTVGQAFAAPAKLYVKRDNKWKDVSRIIRDEAITDRSEQFCYKGQANAVITLINRMARQTENFYCDGCGGGFAFRGTELIRGIARYDIKLTIEDEVVPGELTRILIKPCL